MPDLYFSTIDQKNQENTLDVGQGIKAPDFRHYFIFLKSQLNSKSHYFCMKVFFLFIFRSLFSKL